MPTGRLGRTQPSAPPPAQPQTLPVGRFYGQVDHRWRTELVTLSLLRHAAPRRVPTHSHEHMFLSLLLHGRYREWVDEREIVYRPLTLVFHPERLEHRDEIETPDTTFFCVEVGPALLGGRDRRHRRLRSVHDLSGGSAVWAMLRLLEALRQQQRDALECEETIGELLDELLGQPSALSGRPRWLARVEEHLQTSYREPISLHQLAALAGVHPVHVSRVFRRHCGDSVRACVQRLRVLHACRLITEQGLPLATAAAESGFCDQSHMTRVFLAITGMAPARFRRTARG